MIRESTELIPPRSDPTSYPVRPNASQLRPPMISKIKVSLCIYMCYLINNPACILYNIFDKKSLAGLHTI